MKVEVLVAAVNSDVHELADKMNLETDAIIVNQCDQFAYEEFRRKGRLIRCFSMKERGVGLNRNTALLRTNKDICLFSDEDIVLHTDYEQAIVNAFAELPDADLIVFNCHRAPERRTYYNKSNHRVRWYNYGRYGAVSVAAKREALHHAGVTFSLLFGGGAKYSNGEDSLFLHDCLKKGLHVYAHVAEIEREVASESTWFHGYTEKFFVDRGVLYHYLYRRLAWLWGLRFLVTKRKVMCEEIGLKQAYRYMCKGIREAKQHGTK